VVPAEANGGRLNLTFGVRPSRAQKGSLLNGAGFPTTLKRSTSLRPGAGALRFSGAKRVNMSGLSPGTDVENFFRL